MYKTILSLSIAGLCMLSACKNDVSTTSATSDSTKKEDPAAYKSFDGTERIVAFTQDFTTNKGTKYTVTVRGGETNAAVHFKGQNGDKLVVNQEVRAFGQYNKAVLTDLNNDGEEDIVVFTSLADKSKIGYGYAAVKSGDQATVVTLMPNLPKPYTDNYFGEDSFYVESNKIMREFPKYVLNERRNKKASGKKWKLTYEYDNTPNFKISDGVEIDAK